MITKNDTNHWELENGRELHSGHVVEVYLYGAWRPARVEYFGEGQAYGLYLFDTGKTVGFLLINENMTIRYPEK